MNFEGFSGCKIVDFARMIGERNFVRIDKKVGFAIIGLDSSKADVNSGDIGYDQMKWLKDELEEIPDNLGKFVTFHHHLLPVPQAGPSKIYDFRVGKIKNLQNFQFCAFEISDFDAPNASRLRAPKIHRIFESFADVKEIFY